MLTAHEQPNDQVARITDQDSQGITITGAKMLGTSAIMANEVLVTAIQPLKPGDEPYAVSFAVPMNAAGLKILSRKSYESSANSVFDNLLAQPLRRKRTRSLFRRCQGSVGAGIHSRRYSVWKDIDRASIAPAIRSRATGCSQPLCGYTIG
jgi:hypothetical protein